MRRNNDTSVYKRFINRVAALFGADTQVLNDVGDVDASFREAHGVHVDADEDQWRKLTGDSDRDISPLTVERMQKLAVYLWRSNTLANRIIELPIAFMLAEGVKLSANDEDVNAWLNQFWDDPINNMDIKLTKKVRELSLYGRQCWPAFVGANGHVRLGYLDPALIQTVIMDPDNAEQPIGIITKKNKKGVARRYNVIVNGDDKDLFTERTQAIRQSFNDGDCFYFKINDLSNSSDGASDLLPLMDWLDAYDNFMFGELDRSDFMRAFMWDVKLSNATPDDIKERAKHITAPSPNSVRVHNDAEEWSAVTPDLKSQDTDTIARLFRNHVLSGASIPEHWYGGGGDVNRSTSESMDGPTMKVFSMRQRYIGYILKELGRYVIRQRVMASQDGEPDLHDERYQFTVDWPEMVPKDTTKYAAALTQVAVGVAQVIDRNMMTQQTGLQIIAMIAGNLGVEIDPEVELKNARKENNDDPSDVDDDFDPELEDENAA